MAELQDINGLGPARAESLVEAGYETVEDLAEADHEQAGEEADIPSDTVLEFVVQAQDLVGDEGSGEEVADDEFDLAPKDVSDEVDESEEEPEDDEEDEVEAQTDESDDDSDDEELADDGTRGPFPISLEFNTRLQYDVFHAALMRRWERVYTSNQPAADTMEKLLEGLDNREEVSYELTEAEMNELHSAVTQRRTRYQGDNLIDQMDALQVVQTQIDDARQRHLF